MLRIVEAIRTRIDSPYKSGGTASSQFRRTREVVGTNKAYLNHLSYSLGSHGELEMPRMCEPCDKDC